ncbi:MAG: hypothetical protein ACOYVG_05895 [Bacteroidota bacterium]
METVNDFNKKKLLIGRFYFKKTKNGNLLGEFSHNASQINSSESADIDNYNDAFTGTYYTTWQENKTSYSADLKIEFKENTEDRIYKLTWARNGDEIFLGEGFVCDDILIGDYRNFRIT